MPTPSEEAIARLIDAFYARVRRDPELGVVFAAAIQEDEWPAHLARMRAFWSSVMRGTGVYSGNPVAVHRAVMSLDRALFARWLALFEETATALFDDELAGAFVIKARRIAESLQLALFHRLDRPPDGLQTPVPRTV